MRAITMRQWFASLFLLLQSHLLSSARSQQPLRNDGQVSDVASSKGNDAVREPGADLVQAALLELMRLPQPNLHRTRSKTGVVSYALGQVAKTIPALRISSPPPEATKNIISAPLRRAVDLLEEASQKNNSDALFLLAELNFYGNYSYPRDFSVAFDYYHRLAGLNGNSSALHMVALMYSTGVGGIQRDQARALLFYTFAANAGNTRAEMSVAFRHYAGIGTHKSCTRAAKYYKRVADKAIAWYRSGPPGGMSWVLESHRLSDDKGGAYGMGASVASSGINAIRANPNSDAWASVEDVIEYLDLMSQKGDFKASINLGRIYYDGQRGVERDVALAKRYFFSVTSKYWRKNSNRPVDNFKPGMEKLASRAAGFIGRMFLRGEAGEQNFEKAKFWFERGQQNADGQSQWGLGLMYLYGYGVKKNTVMAIELLRVAAEQDFSPALVQLGALYLDQGDATDIIVAAQYFELAARHGHLEAYYYLGDMTLMGLGREKSCTSAVSYFKSIAERVEPFVSSWREANLAYEDGHLELAFLEYLGAAEQGYEKAQNNVAFLLDTETSMLPLPSWLIGQPPRPSLLTNPTLALMQWTRSSRQGNVDSLVKMGDYYLSGIGVDADTEKAVQCYQGASEYSQSAQAYFNLGWMHENGVGLDQDFHLAKRYYDSALVTNDEAYLPVSLSLMKLRARSAWNTFTHGRINSIQDEPAYARRQRSLREWLNNFIEARPFAEGDVEQTFDDSVLENETEAPSGAVSESIYEMATIVVLCAVLAYLIIYRQQRQGDDQGFDEEGRPRAPRWLGDQPGERRGLVNQPPLADVGVMAVGF